MTLFCLPNIAVNKRAEAQSVGRSSATFSAWFFIGVGCSFSVIVNTTVHHLAGGVGGIPDSLCKRGLRENQNLVSLSDRHDCKIKY